MKTLLILVLLLGAVGAAFYVGLPVETSFKVGSLRIAPADIVLGIALFLIIVTLTKRIQMLLGQRWLKRRGIEPGLSQSIVAVTGYAGFGLGLAVALPVAGIDLSNLAVVAGALSVGIGFGLQNIVNNFVSGLILLFERPVKAGDWVVVGTNEGLIKRINVRSTEIETFNLASVIIPNADLIANPVTNWTHKDRRGRIEVKIQVSPDSDPQLVQDVLLEVAQGHSHIVREPAPTVVFSDIVPQGFDFYLRCYTDDVLLRGQIASELRFLLVDALRAHDVKLSAAPAGSATGPSIRTADQSVASAKSL